MNTTPSSTLAQLHPNVNHSNSPSPSPSSFTPLEQLLLFQALLEFGTRDNDFVRISNLLTNNNLVRDSETYDARRLSVDALRQLYVRLLHEEVRREGQDQEVQEDGTQAGSKKRKLPSPPLPSLKDVQQHDEKLPLLVNKLYARYRDCMIAEIREEERNYARVQREVAEIERGEWDERILREERELASRKGTVPPAPPQLRTNGTTPILHTAVPTPTPPPQSKSRSVEAQRPQVVIKASPVLAPAKASPKISSSPRNEGKPEGLAITDVLNSRAISPVPPPTTQAPDNRVQNGAQSIRPSLKNAQRPVNNGQNHHPQQGPAPLQPPSGLQHPGANVWQWEPTSYGPQQKQHHPPYQSPSPQQQFQPQPQFPPQFQSPSQTHQQTPQFPPQPGQPQQFNTPQYQQQHPPPRGSFSAPHGLPSPRPHVPSSPSPLNTQHPHGILHPPPNGMRQSPGSPSLPLDALADMAGQQQYRPKSGSPMTPQPMQAPPVNYPMQYQQQQQRPSQAQNGGHQPFQSPQYQVASAPYPPQFQPPSSDPRGQYQAQALVPPDNRQYNSPYNASQGPKPVASNTQQNPAPKPRPMLPNTPIAQGVRQFKTGSGTRWTPNPTASTPRPNKKIEPPAVEPLSPVLVPAKPPTVIEKSAHPKKEVTKPEPSKVTKTPKRPTQRKRAGSTASSVVARSQRSQSVATVASRADDFQHVKQEVATPVGGVDDMDDVDELSFTHPHSTPGVSQNQTGKRKREVSNAHEPRPPSSPLTHVLWTRGFPKISASALESVSGHRNASTFAAPVKEKDAPGYSSRVLRPQDLKSIRSAINAGHRAATAAAPADMNNSAVNVWLPISEELVPPKGIINNAQLEKELMRMFANAIMYNPDPDGGLGRRLQEQGKTPSGDVLGYEIDVDGVVKDTRAMFADVEKIITNMRSAERRSEELREASLAIGAGGLVVTAGEYDEGDEGDGDASSVTGSVAKRRRKA